MKKPFFYLILAIVIVAFSACEDCVFDSFEETPGLKKGSRRPTDVQQGDLYGDLIEVEIDTRGVPVLYPLRYRADYQDNVVEGIIDVVNPRLNGPFELIIYVRDDEGYVIMDLPIEGEELVPRTVTVTISPDEDGFVEDPVILYDMEGEILETVTLHVFPVEQGRLNLIRSSPDVLSRRIVEVIKNFGDGTVAAVIRDYCGRLFMVRTQKALDLGIQDKPLDSPLENMAVYQELMLYGFSRSAAVGGLKFLVEEDLNQTGFNFSTKVDKNWDLGALDFDHSDTTRMFIVMNLAASCIAAASDKSGELKLDEILLVNRFLGIPKPVGNDINIPANEVISFFPYVEQELRMMNKTDKSQFSKYRYYIDYTFFWYHRLKFVETMVEFYTTKIVDGVYVKEVEDTLTMHEILSGDTYLPAYITDAARYQEKVGSYNKAVGFANQADDYVQALAVVHNNEEFLVWQMPTPTWRVEESPIIRELSPFLYVPSENEGGGGGGGTGGKGNGGRK